MDRFRWDQRFTYAYDKEDAPEECIGYEIKHFEQGTGHGTNDGKAHQEMRDALLDNTFRNDLLLANFSAVFCLTDLQSTFVLCQRIRMYGRLAKLARNLQWNRRSSYLWHKPIGQRYGDDTSYEARTSQQEEIPVETSRLLERKVPRLRSYTALILQQLCQLWTSLFRTKLT